MVKCIFFCDSPLTVLVKNRPSPVWEGSRVHKNMKRGHLQVLLIKSHELDQVWKILEKFIGCKVCFPQQRALHVVKYAFFANLWAYGDRRTIQYCCYLN